MIIEKGLVLMGAGMGVVLLFLTIMVIVMYGAAAILRRFDKPQIPTGGNGPTRATSDEMAEIAVAIAAVKAHTQS